MGNLGFADCVEPCFMSPLTRAHGIRQDESKKEGEQCCYQNRSMAQHSVNPRVIDAQHLGARNRVEGNYREQRQRMVQQKKQKRGRFPVESGRVIVSPRKNAPVGPPSIG